MEDAENLPREETIADLIKKATDNKVLPILTRCKELIKNQDTQPLVKQTVQALHVGVAFGWAVVMFCPGVWLWWRVLFWPHWFLLVRATLLWTRFLWTEVELLSCLPFYLCWAWTFCFTRGWVSCFFISSLHLVSIGKTLLSISFVRRPAIVSSRGRFSASSIAWSRALTRWVWVLWSFCAWKNCSSLKGFPEDKS